MIWANFLHIYQPPTQTKEMLDLIADESYSVILNTLKENTKGKITLNINASLTELFIKYKYYNLIEDIKLLLERGQIELTDSAAYHAFLPLIPEDEIIRQIELNHKINKSVYGPLYNPKGFFSPELGISEKVVNVVSKMGYKWMLFDELAFEKDKGDIKHDVLYKIKGTNMVGFFRDRDISFKILSAQLENGNIFLAEIKDLINQNIYLPTAMDGETFGHHRPGLELLLEDIFKSDKIKTARYEDLLDSFKIGDSVSIVPSTWALIPTELLKDQPYQRWLNRDNKVNQMQWQLTHFAIEKVSTSKYRFNDLNDKNRKLSIKEKQWYRARSILDKAIHSDQYWWASARPWWSIEMIEKGAYELRESILNLPDLEDEDKKRAINLYKDIIFTAFAWQREGVIDRMANNFDEEAGEIIETKSYDADPKEYDSIIKHLEKQMLESAEKLNFKRAEEFRKRINNLYLKQKGIIGYNKKHGQN